MATKSTDKGSGEAGDAPAPDSPLLDLSDAAVKRMIKLAKKRGFVTHEEINEVLPSEEVTSDQIEDVFAMLEFNEFDVHGDMCCNYIKSGAVILDYGYK